MLQRKAGKANLCNIYNDAEIAWPYKWPYK